MANRTFANHILTVELDTENYKAYMLRAKRSREKHPTMGKDYVHAAAVVCEEAGELVRAALQTMYEDGKYYLMHREAVQVGATALRFCTEGAPELPWSPPGKAKNRT